MADEIMVAVVCVQVLSTIDFQHVSTLINETVVNDSMKLVCENCWFGESWSRKLHLYQVLLLILMQRWNAFPLTHLFSLQCSS